MPDELIAIHDNTAFAPTRLYSWNGLVTTWLGADSTEGAFQCSIQPGSTLDNAYIAVDSDVNPTVKILHWDGANLNFVTGYNPGAVNYSRRVCWNPVYPQWLAVSFRGILGTAPYIWILKFDGTNLTYVTREPTFLMVEDFRWSSDGKYIAAVKASQAADLRYLAVFEFDGANLTEIDSKDGPAWPTQYVCYRVAWTRDDQYIINDKRIPPPATRWIALNKWNGSSITGEIDTLSFGAYPISFGIDCCPLWERRHHFIVPYGNLGAPNDNFIRAVKIENDLMSTVDTHTCEKDVGPVSFNTIGNQIAVSYRTNADGREVRFFDYDGISLTHIHTQAIGVNPLGGVAFLEGWPIAPVLGAPHNLLCEQKKNPIDVTDPQPEFSAMHKYD